MATTTAGPFKLQARQYRDIGFNPVPIRPGTESPAPSRWQTGRQEDEVFQHWLAQYPDHGLGVVLGTPLESVLTGGADLRGQFLIAVDVDQDDLSESVRHALRVHQSNICAKRGAKDLTIFARGGEEQKNRMLRRHDVNGPGKTLVEILSAGSQTVIPPTIHPNTHNPYEWIGVPLNQARLRDLPELTDSMMDEIMSVADGPNQHFDGLRTMVWAGEGGGGNTHDTCVAAVASLVARGWKDTQIHERIEFATREACIRAGMPYDWPGSSRAIQEWIDSARKKGMDDVGAAGANKASQGRVLAAWLIEQYGGADACVSLGRGILHYRDGRWVETGVDQRELEQRVLEHFHNIDVMKARQGVETALGSGRRPSSVEDVRLKAGLAAMATSRGNKRMSGAVDAAETRVGTVVAPTGFEPVFQP